MPLIPVHLALSAGEIVAIVMAILTILGGVMGQANEAKKTKERREAKKRGDLPARSEAVTDVDSLAQRRREQLEAMASRRRGAPGSQSRPDNLTTAQAAEREAAKAAYAARAAEMREQGAVNPMLSRGQEGGRAHVDAEAERAASRTRQAGEARQASLERARRKQEKRARQQQAREEARRKSQRQQSVPVEEEQEGGPSRHLEQLGTDVSGRQVAIADLGRGAREVDTAAHGDAYESEEVHRHVSDVSEAATALPSRPNRVIGLMAGRTWRDVFLLKEMLDPPLAMRQERGPSDPFAR